MADLVALLGELIRHDTQNPDGDEGPLARRLEAELGARGPDQLERVEVPRHGAPAGARPRAYVWAAWGTPRTIVNVHLDTVPANTGWSTPPHEPRVEAGLVYGLGAADTKGAIAATLAALDEARPQNFGVLFSGDEELDGTCVRAFLHSGRGAAVERAIVCEPTGCRVGVRHRGILAIEARQRGKGGHSSGADHMPAPVAELARAAVAVADWGVTWRRRGPAGFEGMCVNVARLDGGIAFNVVPDEARLMVSLRPPPGADAQVIRAEVEDLISRATPGVEIDVPLANPTFATSALGAFGPLLGTRVDAPIDLPFWTEAAVLAAAGIDAVVFGPGDISQAHAPDEHVSIEQLETAKAALVQVLHGCR
jgi:acetylornithine deacetylase